MAPFSPRIACAVGSVIAFLLLLECATGFAPPVAPLQSPRTGKEIAPTFVAGPVRQESTSLHSFLGSDGGILGIGAPEVFTILLVGYFVLGPSDLYKLVKEIGKGIQNFRTLSSDVTKTFENNMESQLQLEELRKAQRELNDAFSFRRSINVDDQAQAFATTPTMGSSNSTTTTTPTATEENEAPTASSSVPTKRKKIRRVKKKKLVPVEEEDEEVASTAKGTFPTDLEMPPPWDDNILSREEEEQLRLEEEEEEEQEKRSRRERIERLQTETQPRKEEAIAATHGETEQTEEAPLLEMLEPSWEEKDRFAKQLSSNWNEQIMANTDKLEPLAKVMERLAILEEEHNAAESRLEEEFRLRAELEEKYYKKQRALLEETAAEVQANAYVSMDGGGSDDNKKVA